MIRDIFVTYNDALDPIIESLTPIKGLMEIKDLSIAAPIGRADYLAKLYEQKMPSVINGHVDIMRAGFSPFDKRGLKEEFLPCAGGRHAQEWSTELE